MDNIKKILKIILILIIIIILLIIILLFFVKKDSNNNENENINSTDIQTEEYKNSLSEEAKKQSDVSNEEKILISNCLQKYYNALNINSTAYYGILYGEYQQLYNEEEIQEQVYQYLSEKYIKENNIKENNVFNFVNSLNVSPIVIPYEIKKVDNNNLSTFVVSVAIENLENYNFINQEYLIINFDKEKNIFSIEPKGNNFDNIDEINLEELEENIIEQELNTYQTPSATYEDITRYYFNAYKRLSLGAPEIAYQLLNEEYRNERFGNVNNFKNYVQENRESISNIQPNEYSVEVHDSYTEYIIRDRYKNVYIFDHYKEGYSVYDMKLDTYTIATENFLEEYTKASNEKKVQMNIDKFIQMINRQDYRTSYNCISEGFKSNYFNTQEDFEKYIKNNFFNYNNFEFKNITQKGSNLYTCDLNVTDLTEENTATRNITIIMQLKDNLDFEMSFSID